MFFFLILCTADWTQGHDHWLRVLHIVTFKCIVIVFVACFIIFTWSRFSYNINDHHCTEWESTILLKRPNTSTLPIALAVNKPWWTLLYIHSKLGSACLLCVHTRTQIEKFPGKVPMSKCHVVHPTNVISLVVNYVHSTYMQCTVPSQIPCQPKTTISNSLSKTAYCIQYICSGTWGTGITAWKQILEVVFQPCNYWIYRSVSRLRPSSGTVKVYVPCRAHAQWLCGLHIWWSGY